MLPLSWIPEVSRTSSLTVFWVCFLLHVSFFAAVVTAGIAADLYGQKRACWLASLLMGVLGVQRFEDVEDKDRPGLNAYRQAGKHQ